MHKSAVSLGEDGGDTKGKEAIIEVLENNPGPTFNMIGVAMLSIVVSTMGMELASAIGACGSWSVNWSTIMVFPL